MTGVLLVQSAVAGLLSVADVASPSATPSATVTTVHAAGAALPTWGLAFLVAVFVVAVAIALPASLRRTRQP